MLTFPRIPVSMNRSGLDEKSETGLPPTITTEVEISPGAGMAKTDMLIRRAAREMATHIPLRPAIKTPAWFWDEP
jgi:hypothetical protein